MGGVVGVEGLITSLAIVRIASLYLFIRISHTWIIKHHFSFNGILITGLNILIRQSITLLLSSLFGTQLLKLLFGLKEGFILFELFINGRYLAVPL